MDDFSNKRVLIYDEGQFNDLATRLARDWGSVQLYCPWKQSAPTSTRLMVGNGLDGVERVTDFWDAVPGADLIVFTDCYNGDLQVHLEEQGHRVWGSRKADRYEWDRQLFKDALKEVGLPVSAHKVIKGLSRLRDYLRENPDQVVKLSRFRGDSETFAAPTYALIKGKLDALEFKYGPLAEKVKFMVEETIPTLTEAGYDGICIDGQFTDGFIDYETKFKSCLIAIKPYDELPEVVREVNEKFAPILAREHYRGPMGTEIRVAEDGTPYFIDLTARNASPPGETMWVALKNLSEVMYRGAAGEMVTAEWAGKYACQIMLFLEWEDQAWQGLSIPNKNKPFVMLSTYAKVDGLYYPIPCEGYETLPWANDGIGCAIGIGDTVEEAIDLAKAHAESVEGYKVNYDLSAIAEGLAAVKSGEEQGIEFADEVPEPASVLESE